MQTAELVELVLFTLEDNKAQDIKTLDVKHLTTITDCMIICTATSTRHAITLGDKVLRACKNAGVKPYGTEGQDQGEWVLLDLSDVVVHVMLAATRELYSLEKLWNMTEASRQESI